MATLAAQIAISLRLLVADETIVDFTRQRDLTATTEDTTVTVEAARLAAAVVESYLGDNLTDADVLAVRFGVRLALADIADIYSMRFTDEGRRHLDKIEEKLESEMNRRGLEADGFDSSADRDFTDLDRRYPEVETWQESS